MDGHYQTRQVLVQKKPEGWSNMKKHELLVTYTESHILNVEAENVYDAIEKTHNDNNITDSPFFCMRYRESELFEHPDAPCETDGYKGCNCSETIFCAV